MQKSSGIQSAAHSSPSNILANVLPTKPLDSYHDSSFFISRHIFILHNFISVRQKEHQIRRAIYQVYIKHQRGGRRASIRHPRSNRSNFTRIKRLLDYNFSYCSMKLVKIGSDSSPPPPPHIFGLHISMLSVSLVISYHQQLSIIYHILLMTSRHYHYPLCKNSSLITHSHYLLIPALIVHQNNCLLIGTKIHIHTYLRLQK
jgi:hypothetical protein